MRIISFEQAQRQHDNAEPRETYSKATKERDHTREDLANAGKPARCPIAASGECQETECNHFHHHAFLADSQKINGTSCSACRKDCGKHLDMACVPVSELDEDWVIDNIQGEMINIKGKAMKRPDLECAEIIAKCIDSYMGLNWYDLEMMSDTSSIILQVLKNNGLIDNSEERTCGNCGTLCSFNGNKLEACERWQPKK